MTKTTNHSIGPHSRHGGAYDRGRADRYYGRPFSPHFYVGVTYSTARVSLLDETGEAYTAYQQGWNEETDRKDWD